VKTTIIKDAVPEVVMVGSQAPFAAVSIPGRLAYVSAGNAWIMEENTENRRPIVTTGDLDGRVLSLSPDGNWLLYTRSDEDENTINTLWVAKADDDSGLTIDLGVANVVHFADWVPGEINRVIYSSAESITTAPGWKANNDLKYVNFSSNGWVSRPNTVLESRSDGKYSWWGTTFTWSPDGEQLAYSRPDSVGLVDFETEDIASLLEITTLLTRSDWAWMPRVSWGPDGNFLYTVDHAPQEGLISDEESPLFDLTAIPLLAGSPVPMVAEVGMFAYPVASPEQILGTGEKSYLISFLQAIIPTQSESSGYRLALIDRDGSNLRTIFPPDGAPGLEPQRLAWAPTGEENPLSSTIALIYQGDLWLVDTGGEQTQQLTGDGLTTVLDWK
jgi:hypothetical protein